jgi:hypothetical protein
MATPPITETSIDVPRRRRRLSFRVFTRTVWLVADVGAVAICAYLALHGAL